MKNSVPFIAISRHRIATDGDGVTTLAAFYGCPLHCKYCINSQCKNDIIQFPQYTPQLLLEEISKDDLYFQATGGGVTFGGGEPMLYPDFIAEFREISNPLWKLNVETSLHCPLPNLEKIADSIDKFIIDIKDMNSVIYQKYTGHPNSSVVSNLHWIASHDMQEKCIIRVPLIPGYNSSEDVKNSRIYLDDMGFENIDEFEYFIL